MPAEHEPLIVSGNSLLLHRLDAPYPGEPVGCGSRTS